MVPQDLLAFRVALSKLDSLETANERRRDSRYVPSGPLSRAKVKLPCEDQIQDADVVDLSVNGIRLALAAGAQCREGDRCQILIAPHEGTTWTLDGEIRWVTHHPYITVFGVLLDPDHGAFGPV